MSHCYICDNYIQELQLDVRDNKIKPCSECQEIIMDNLNSLLKRNKSPYEDLPQIEDDWDNLVQLEDDLDKDYFRHLETYEEVE